MAVRFTLKLKEGKSPHLYVSQIAKLMEGDKTLHPMMKRTLLMLKKTRTPYIFLSTKREIIIDEDNLRHFERAVEPRPSAWIVTYWSDEEVEQHNEDPDAHLKAFMNMMEGLGYEFFNAVKCSHDYMVTIESLCRKQIDAIMQGRENEY